VPRVDYQASRDSCPATFPSDASAKTWAWSSTSLRAVDLEFAVRSDNPRLGRYLDSIFRSQRADGPATTEISVVAGGPGAGSAGWDVCVDATRRHRCLRAGEVVPALLAEINNEVIRASSARHVLLHASGAAKDDRCAIFHAPPEAGKTTLVAGLVLAGLRYVTDEAVALDVESGLVRSFPKPLSIDPGAWGVLGALRPSLDDDLAEWAVDQWHVDPGSIRPDAVAGPCRPRFVVATRYASGARTRLHPVHRADALTNLMHNAFETNRRDGSMFNIVSTMVREAECYELVVGDLTQACELVLALFE
jgi:hypothetical protein